MIPIRGLVLAAGPHAAVIDLGGSLVVVDPRELDLEPADLVDLEIVDGRSFVVLEAPDLTSDDHSIVILEGAAQRLALRVPRSVNLPDVADLRMVRVALEVDEGFGPSARQLAAEDPALPEQAGGYMTPDSYQCGAGI